MQPDGAIGKSVFCAIIFSEPNWGQATYRPEREKQAAFTALVCPQKVRTPEKPRASEGNHVKTLCVKVMKSLQRNTG